MEEIKQQHFKKFPQVNLVIELYFIDVVAKISKHDGFFYVGFFARISFNTRGASVFSIRDSCGATIPVQVRRLDLLKFSALS